MEENFIEKYIGAPFYSKVSDQLRLTDLKEKTLPWYSINQSQIRRNSIFASNKQSDIIDDIIEDDNNLNTCIPRYQLIRIKYGELLSAEYLIRVHLFFVYRVTKLANNKR